MFLVVERAFFHVAVKIVVVVVVVVVVSISNVVLLVPDSSFAARGRRLNHEISPSVQLPPVVTMLSGPQPRGMVPEQE
jgi:hypothetical protein